MFRRLERLFFIRLRSWSFLRKVLLFMGGLIGIGEYSICVIILEFMFLWECLFVY